MTNVPSAICTIRVVSGVREFSAATLTATYCRIMARFSLCSGEIRWS